MSKVLHAESVSDALKRLAGYVNFSSGQCDVATMAAWNRCYGAAVGVDPLSGPPAFLVLKDLLSETLDELHAQQPAFRDITQGRRVVRLLWSELLPAYVDFHRDLLFHQEPEVLFNGFFLAYAAEAILSIPSSSDAAVNDASVVNEAIERLNDFVGYRPVAILENRRCEPYPHEFMRPIPLFVQDAGVSAGPYRELVQLAIDALCQTDANILRSASFDLDRMKELALDPRAYDFDHPVNRRPNYHFGGWDDRAVGNDGYYQRFILRQVTLDALLERLNEPSETCQQELLVESATVLAGTILMASGISGWGPAAHSSEITLGTLMKPIANYRDAFYEDRMRQLSGPHAERLNAEQQRRQQPFGAARQHLNAALAQRRAAQLQHAQLARLYARMGYPDAATRQVDTVPATSARMMCRIDCEMTLGLRALRAGDIEKASQVPGMAFELIKRAIGCGALIDPWNILGFSGNFHLFVGPESAIHDSRLDDLLYLIEQLFGYTARIWSEAAARNDQKCYDEMSEQYQTIAEWWHQFAAHTLDSIEAADPMVSYDSAKLVARALRFWHEGGAATGDVRFWAQHADLFDSPRAYALVISALLERRDFVSSMALLVHWLSNADRIGLRLGGSSLPRLAENWLLRLRGTDVSVDDRCEEQFEGDAEQTFPSEVWRLARKFFDYLEANAEKFWSAPTFRLQQRKKLPRDWDHELTAVEQTEDEEGIYDAAYEGMTYRDTTNDGNQGAIFEGRNEFSLEELESESKRLIDHLTFLQSLARMWAVAADVAIASPCDPSTTAAPTATAPTADGGHNDRRDQLNSLRGWARRARENRVGLLELLDSVREYKIESERSDKESMRSYDRSRVIRDSLMERIINTAVEMSDARRLICGALLTLSTGNVAEGEVARNGDGEEMAEDDEHAVQMFAALIAGDTDSAKKIFPAFLDALRDKNLLYIPLSRGGDPVKIYVARLRQRVLRHLMHWLPRRGLIVQACQLIETAREMEQRNSVGIGAVTEFDGLFRAGFRSLVTSLVHSARCSSRNGGKAESGNDDAVAEELIPLLERLTETLLGSWLAHSHTLRLSPLEAVSQARNWDQLVEFVTKYGDPIFTQTFLQLGNVRAVLHQGVAVWLRRVIDEGEDLMCDTRLCEDLESGVLSIEEAERWITLVYESLIDHHAEYQDYNSTTTQSDRGDLIYMFMDFLRLRMRYERIAWNLKPVMWAHEVLVRSGLDESAMIWRRSLSERIGSEAELYVNMLKKMQQDYAMRMPTVADRIMERFVQPMTIARMRALVGPAMRDAEANHRLDKKITSREFDLLEQEAELLTRHPSGVGLDVPAWLYALEEEVEQLAKRRSGSEIDPQKLMTISMLPMTVDEMFEQLATARLQGRRLPHMKDDSSE